MRLHSQFFVIMSPAPGQFVRNLCERPFCDLQGTAARQLSGRDFWAGFLGGGYGWLAADCKYVLKSKINLFVKGLSAEFTRGCSDSVFEQ